jgi:hypothetical protein
MGSRGQKSKLPRSSFVASTGPSTWSPAETFWVCPLNRVPYSARKCRHRTVAIAAILRGKVDNVPGQLIFIGFCRGNISLCPPGLPNDPAGGAFAEPVCFTSCLHRLPAPFRAYKFPCAISCRTGFSSDRTATSFFSLPFSVSSCFRRLA